MERQVFEIAVAAEKGISNHSTSSVKSTRIGLKVAMSLFLPYGAVATTPGWPLCGDIILPRISITVSGWFPLRVWQDPCRKFELVFWSVTLERAHLSRRNSMQGNTTEIKGGKTQQEEAACDIVVQVEPFFFDWVDELSQVAGTLRAGKAI